LQARRQLAVLQQRLVDVKQGLARALSRTPSSCVATDSDVMSAIRALMRGGVCVCQSAPAVGENEPGPAVTPLESYPLSSTNGSIGRDETAIAVVEAGCASGEVAAAAASM